MSVPNEDNMSPHTQLSSHFLGELLDSIIVDVASECHRIAKLGLDRNSEEEEEELRLSAQARVTVAAPSHSCETNGKYVVDIFGQTHPTVANEVFDCMNCGRPIVAGRFAPHLEKCMGKYRVMVRHKFWQLSVGILLPEFSNFHSLKTPSVLKRVGRLVSRPQEVAQQHRTGTHEAVLFLHTPLIQMPPAHTSYQMEHTITQSKSTQMEHVKSHESSGSIEKGSFYAMET
uniref:SAGA-associated factor 11 n=1 Tax=Salix viminalis TaxID=40686 RepID=A0A6N2L5F2_SALVM